MIQLKSSDIKIFLETQHRLKILDVIDLDWLMTQPRKTLFEKFQACYRDRFEADERIVVFSRDTINEKTLIHIQKCAAKIDISNFFILFCSPAHQPVLLDHVRRTYSSDDLIFNICDITVLDPIISEHSNPHIHLPESFCFSPWAHLEILSTGDFRPCCVYTESIKDVDGRIFNIAVDSIESVYESEYLNNLRKDFLQGKQPNHCSHCWHKESAVGHSNRTWLTEHLGVNADLLDVEQASVRNIISLDIKLGNTCNFKCRICNPVSSSRIAEERYQYFDRSIDLKMINSQGRWTERPEIWSNLQKLGGQLINIDFYGGEPFLIKQHDIFLNYLIDQKFASKIRLHYNSNGSIFPRHFFERWKFFREVDIVFSIDNIGQRFEMERGGRWSEIEKNLDDFQSWQLPHMRLGIFVTVSALNIYYLPDLIEWTESRSINTLILNILETPEFFCIRNMGSELTDKVIKRLESMSEKIREKYNIDQILHLLKTDKKLGDRRQELQDYMLKLDKIRNQDFMSSHREVAELIYIGKTHGQTV